MERATAQRLEREIELLKLDLEKQNANNADEQTSKYEERLNKMKEIYAKFRAEHIELLKMVLILFNSI